jgi:LacI family transcriptional regulator
VSVRTVSRVLNQAPNVDDRTRETVITVIEQLGFRRNSRARGLAAGRSFLLGVVQDDPNTHVIAVFQRGIASLCAEEGYELVVHSSRSDERLVDDVVAFVQRSHVDGIILLPPLSEQAGLAEALAALKVPAVGIAAVRVPGFPAMLVSDEHGAARRVAEHLAHLGHRTIGFITGGEGMHSSIEREQGFRAGLTAQGLALGAEYIRQGDYSFASGYAAARALLELAEPPTAIFASNDNMAAGALKAAIERGVPVPDRLSIIGFDDSDIASMVTPGLTTIHRPFGQMGRDATRQLLKLIDGPEPVPDLAVPLPLVERGSTARRAGAAHSETNRGKK